MPISPQPTAADAIRKSSALHGFSIFVALWALGVVFAGGLVTSKDAGLSVPDWPLAYGKFFPENWLQIENVRAEHGHRIVAGILSVLSLWLAIWLWRAESRTWMRWLGVSAFALVILQGAFGALTVRFTRPVPVTVGHGLLGQSFFCISVAIVLFTSRNWQDARPSLPHRAGASLHFACGLLVAAVFVQLILGAIMRHTQSGLAIHDFPLSFGALIPATDAEALRKVNFDRFELGLGRVSATQVWYHYAHRVGAAAVCLAALFPAVQIRRRFGAIPELAFPIVIILVGLAGQVTLGALTVWSGRQPHIATIHVALGATILAATVILALQSFRLVGGPERGLAPARGSVDSTEAVT